MNLTTGFFVAYVSMWSVIDGDTIRVSGHIWPNVSISEERVRLVRIDTPEMRAPTACERAMAVKATDYSNTLLRTANQIEVRVYFKETRDSFGRVLGDVFVDGVSLNDLLLASGLARKYGVKGAWC